MHVVRGFTVVGNLKRDAGARGQFESCRIELVIGQVEGIRVARGRAARALAWRGRWRRAHGLAATAATRSGKRAGECHAYSKQEEADDHLKYGQSGQIKFHAQPPPHIYSGGGA